VHCLLGNQALLEHMCRVQAQNAAAGSQSNSCSWIMATRVVEVSLVVARTYCVACCHIFVGAGMLLPLAAPAAESWVPGSRMVIDLVHAIMAHYIQ
jgi:hypothetical protein